MPLVKVRGYKERSGTLPQATGRLGVFQNGLAGRFRLGRLSRVLGHSGNRMNYFVLASIPLYLGAAINSLMNGNRMMAGAWMCYATANAFLMFVELK